MTAAPFTSERTVTAPPAHRSNASGAVEALCAAAGIVLAIIGLAGASRFFDAIAGIVVGAAFLFEQMDTPQQQLAVGTRVLRIGVCDGTKLGEPTPEQLYLLGDLARGPLRVDEVAV